MAWSRPGRSLASPRRRPAGSTGTHTRSGALRRVVDRRGRSSLAWACRNRSRAQCRLRLVGDRRSSPSRPALPLDRSNRLPVGRALAAPPTWRYTGLPDVTLAWASVREWPL